jgi:hypothetical protein
MATPNEIFLRIIIDSYVFETFGEFCFKNVYGNMLVP